MYVERSAQQTDSLDDLLSEEGTVTVQDVAVASVSAPRMTKAQRMLPKRDRVLLALTERPVSYRAGDKRSLYQKQRSALITQAYTAIKAGMLDASEDAIKAFCAENWTAPVLDDYDAGTGAPSPRGVILASKQEQLIQGVVAHVFAHYNPDEYSKVQRARVLKRWATQHRTVDDLLSLPEGMTAKEQAEALNCSIRMVYRLREKAATSGMSQPSEVTTETVTSKNTATSGMAQPTYEQYCAMGWSDKWDALDAGYIPVAPSGNDYDPSDPMGLLTGIEL